MTLLTFKQFRINVKDNILKINQIFAHGFGFRANIDLLQPQRPGHQIRRREIYETLQELITQLVHVLSSFDIAFTPIFFYRHGFDGRACILKTLCDASSEIKLQNGMLSRIFKMIFT